MQMRRAIAMLLAWVVLFAFVPMPAVADDAVPTPAPSDSFAPYDGASEPTPDATTEPDNSTPTTTPDAAPVSDGSTVPTGEPTDEPTAETTSEPTVEPTAEPTSEPTVEPTAAPMSEPTVEPTAEPTSEQTGEPTADPTSEPSVEPTAEPTSEPTGEPTAEPTSEPTGEPTAEPTSEPTGEPTTDPTSEPTAEPTTDPTSEPTGEPTADPTSEPTGEPTTDPTSEPTAEPTTDPTSEPTGEPTAEPTSEPTGEPTTDPTSEPTGEPTTEPTATPTGEPTAEPTSEPTGEPTTDPTSEPTGEPTADPTSEPTGELTAEPTSEPTGEPTTDPTSEPTGEPTTDPTSEPTGEPTTDPTSEPTGEPTAEPTSEPTDEPTTEPTTEPTAEPTATPEPMSIQLVQGTALHVAGVDAITVQLAIEGGMPAYAVTYQVWAGESLMTETASAETSFSYLPEAAGVYTIAAIVTDAAGQSASDSVSATVIAQTDVLSVSLPAEGVYGVAGMRLIALDAVVSGGVGEVAAAWQVSRDGAVVHEAAAGEAYGFTYLPDAPGDYTVTVIVTDTVGQSASASQNIIAYPVPEPLTVSLTAAPYGYVGRIPVDVAAAIEGGMAEYAVLYQVFTGGEEALPVAEYAGTEHSWVFVPEAAGEYVITVTVTDGAGQVQSASVQTSVAADDPANRDGWFDRAAAVVLTGDWRTDLVAVCDSQVGYHESTIDFAFDDAGNREGYSIYGAYYDVPYAEWCTLYIRYCAQAAGIPAEHFPIADNCADTRDALAALGAYEPVDSGYVPQPGDLVFFTYTTRDFLYHMGVVKELDGSILRTYEGHAPDSVIFQMYDIADLHIAGYGNMAKLMVLADAFPQDALTVDVEIGLNTPDGGLDSEGAAGDSGTGFAATESDQLTFRYSDANTVTYERVWNPELHAFVNVPVEPDEWDTADGAGNCIRVTNTSPVAIDIIVHITQDEVYVGQIQILIDGQSSAAATLEPGASADFTISINGAAQQAMESGALATLGRVDVAVAAAAPADAAIEEE